MNDLVNLVPPSELGLDLVAKHIIQKGRVKEDPSTGSDDGSLGVNAPHNHNLPPRNAVVCSILTLV